MTTWVRARRSRPPATGGSRQGLPLPLVVAAVGLVAVALSVRSAPDPAPMRVCWRTASFVLAGATGAWNLLAAWRAFRRNGFLSAVGMLQLWSLFAFSWAAAEQCFRYDQLSLGFWQGSLDNAGTFGTVALLTGFQVLFFVALGRDVPLHRFVPVLRSAGPGGAPGDRLVAENARTRRGQRRVTLILLAVAAPFVAARLVALSQLGLRRLVLSMVTRTEYFGLVDGGTGTKVNPVIWMFGILFPIFGVTLLCLAVRYGFHDAGRRGAFCYAGVLVLCGVCVLPSGGRGDLVFVVVAVLFAMRAHGYRGARAYRPVLVPIGLAGVLLLLLAQARTGHVNSLTSLAGNPYVGNSYSSGEITQVLGTGRFDAVRMIVNRHSTAHGFGVQDYFDAVKGSLNSIFLPRIVAGHALSSWHPSLQVMGPWQFGAQKTSSLPSAPGELYLAFGVRGVLVGAFLFGLVTRVLLRVVAGLPGPAQITWVLAVWTVALGLSTEAYLVGSFVAQHWPVIPVIGLLVRRHLITGRAMPQDRMCEPRRAGWPASSGRALPADGPPAGPPGRTSSAVPTPRAGSLRRRELDLEKEPHIP
ncbi:hypothetical protein I6A60_37300 [Frankia sp. AgB1.9]|uniref:hypothetical protein n=1 Tax=unclassified Frankia TaxID=2632575 RepID=UPI0019324943|nr:MULTISPECIES: hypothetical protein [unclassified Frankia]MBL7493549.1 hypothetical protein [Frankia sp. AgW1.1]MBL7553459.1 hypothetical protein [Frankia sp. AgB1.9]MBL7622312.1 hypothetical protein [Frankia sp. AgB1.8]